MKSNSFDLSAIKRCRHNVNVYFPGDQYDRLRFHADRLNVPFSRLVKQATIDLLDRLERQHFEEVRDDPPAP